jgi:hypothetical protein
MHIFAVSVHYFAGIDETSHSKDKDVGIDED